MTGKHNQLHLPLLEADSERRGQKDQDSMRAAGHYIQVGFHMVDALVEEPEVADS